MPPLSKVVLYIPLKVKLFTYHMEHTSMKSVTVSHVTN
jgi:hypothetical protein